MSKKDAAAAPVERLEAMKFALLDHLNAGSVEGCEPLSEKMTCELLQLIESLIYGAPRTSKSKDVNAVAVARDIVLLFHVTREDAVEAGFNDPNRDLGSLTRQYDRILPTLAGGARPLSAKFDEVFRAYKRTKHYKTNTRRQKKR